MRWLFGLIALPLILSTGLFLLATDAKPSLKRTVQVGVADLDRGKAIVDSLGLRRMRDGETRQLVIPEGDLDLAASYLAARFTKGSASAQIGAGRLALRASIPVPGVHRFLNARLDLAQDGDTLVPVGLRLGDLPVPGALSGDLVALALSLSPYSKGFAAARKILDSAQLVDQGLALRFTWRGADVDQAMAGGVGRGSENAVIDAYRAHLGQVKSRDFAVLMGEAFALAKQRSSDHDPVAENRAALTALAETALGSRLLSRRGLINPSRRPGALLMGRDDFPQHFALSAFIAATGGEGLSDLAGVYKEIKDSQGGSGFSFNDIAADRAGSRFGEVSTRSRSSARNIQARLAGSRDPSRFFPKVSDLPEFMSQSEFRRRFGGIGQPAYMRMVEEIEARIAALAIYKD